MPLYEYECQSEHVSTVTSSVADRPARIVCLTCGKDAERIMSLPKVVTDGEEYADENLCTAEDPTPFHVRGNSHKRQRLRDLGLVQKEPTYRDRHNEKRGRVTVPLKAG